MRKYNSYKPSMVEWIGEIPVHWKMVSLKHLVSTKITDGPHETPIFLDEGIPFLSVESVQDNKLDFNKKRGFISKEVHEVYSKKCKPQKDDVLIVKSGSTTGKSTIVETDIEFNIWSPLCIVRSDKNKILPRFTFSSIQSDYFRRSIELGWSFGTQPNIGMGVIENIKLVVPPLPEQLQIIQYLNEKTNIIDKLISTKERKIDLLKEQRTSIINQVITKGLDPGVKMKEIEVKLIGKIPEHWKFIPMKFILKKVKGSIKTGPFGSQLKSEDFVEQGVKVYNQRSVYDENFDQGETYISEQKYILLKEFRVFEGDILFSTRGTIGKCSIVPEGIELGVLHPCLIRIQVIENIVSKRFIWWYINHSTLFLDSVRRESNSTTIDVIYSETIKNHKIPLPPFEEQLEIIDYLDNQIKEIDDLIIMEQKKIDLLTEYRQSLISEVITGKIDVRTNVN